MIPDLAGLPPLYILIPLALIALAIARRIPVIGTLVSIASWIVLIGLVVTLFTQRAQLDPYLGKVAGLLRSDGQTVVGKETRLRMADDGHFWARVTINGVERRMLVDSGATVTAMSADTAAAVGLAVETPLVPVLLSTANGTVRARTATVPELTIGNIVARDVAVVVSPNFGNVDVIGMNLLSRLASWRVEGRTMILVPHHPQAVTGA
ncbi:peptidase [Sphingomonas sp. Leaf17]|uniref:retropepsin-like aspartic protease family protein n=1 Tax=Sphingomonas sp. Leaf17 TaxID=1735683 RepID=UPI0006F73D4B|nr:TIGR02281 family clan AA aspartic protease [Sphingomonas sp. Leaf17]KQM68029.1 peptidase [Sphingomonas sp. Leaf17]